MRSISFSLTEQQFLAGTKDVTRRLGWLKLKPGDRLKGVRKAMGLKKGEHQVVLGEIEVVSVRREQLRRMTNESGYGRVECAREGFPLMGPAGFVAFFCASHGRCTPETVVTRIEFRRVDA